jgi:RNA polymerase sigma-B factor
MGRTRKATSARNRRVVSHLALVEPLVRHYGNRCAESLDDLRQVALEGLIHAAERFNVSRQVPFAAYARPHIRGALLHYLRDRAHLIRIPRRMQEQHAREKASTLALGGPSALQPLSRRVIISQEELEALGAVQPEPVGQDPSVGDLLQELPPKQRRLVQLVVLQGRSLRAVAQDHGISASTVHRQLRQALEQLRRQLNPASDARGC